MNPIQQLNAVVTAPGSENIKPAANRSKSNENFSRLMERATQPEANNRVKSLKQFKSEAMREKNPFEDMDDLPDEIAELLGAVNNAAIQTQTDNAVSEAEAQILSDVEISLITGETGAVIPENTVLPQGSGNESFVSVLEGTAGVTDNAETMARTPASDDVPTGAEADEMPPAVHETIAALRSLENVNEPQETGIKKTGDSERPLTDSPAPAEGDSVGVHVQSTQKNSQTGSESSNDGNDDAKTSDVQAPAAELAPKQVNANESFRGIVGESAPAEGVPPNELLSRIVESATLMRGAESDVMTLQLKPENLGRVEVQLSLSAEGSLTLKVTANDRNVSGMLNSQIGQLVESLSSKGLKVESAEVVYSGVENDMFSQDGNQRSGSYDDGQGRRGQRSIRPVEADVNGFAYEIYETYWGEDEEAAEYMA